MSQHNLSVERRQETGKSAAKRLRREGRVPAVIYGHNETPELLSLNAKELRDLMAHGQSHGLLMLQENGSQMPAIIKALQRNPVSHTVDSVDFLRVSLNEEVTSTVPIVLTGTQPDVKSGDGVLVQSLMELQISSLPQNMPESITVDVSNLVLNGAPIHVGELSLPQGVKALTDPDEAVAVVNLPQREETEEPSTPLGEEETAAAANAVPATE